MAIPEESSQSNQLNSILLQRLMTTLDGDAHLAPASKHTYRNDLARFADWCDQHDAHVLPVAGETVLRFAESEKKAGYKAGTIDRRLHAISWAHRSQGFDSPIDNRRMRQALASLRREVRATTTSKEPMKIDQLAMVLEARSDTRLGSRDRAVFLLEFAGEFAVSEIAALTMADVTLGVRGMTVFRHRPAHGRRGSSGPAWVDAGQWPETDPLRAMRDWLRVRGLEEGPLFCAVDRHGNLGKRHLTTRGIQMILKRAAEEAGVDRGRFSTGSLRKGLQATAEALQVNEFRALEPRQHELKRRRVTPGAAPRQATGDPPAKRPVLNEPVVRQDLMLWINSGIRIASELDSLIARKHDCEIGTAATWRRRLRFKSDSHRTVTIPKGE